MKRTKHRERDAAIFGGAVLLTFGFLLGCEARAPEASSAEIRTVAQSISTLDADTTLAKATFAGGCFWCMEPPFEKLEGVEAVISGYAGGEKVSPTYEEVSSGRTDHVEAVQIYYDPQRISYEALLDAYWRSFDPTDTAGQFADRGAQYAPAIFYHTDRQRELAEASKQKLEETGPFEEPIVTPIRRYTTFYPAEGYHQDFYKKNPDRYRSYAVGSGRVGFLEEKWGK